MKTAVLVSLENERADLRQDSKLLISDSDEVDSFCTEGVHGALVDSTDSHEDKVAKLFCVLEISIIDKLHQEQHVEEDLALGNLRDFGSSLG